MEDVYDTRNIPDTRKNGMIIGVNNTKDIPDTRYNGMRIDVTDTKDETYLILGMIT